MDPRSIRDRLKKLLGQYIAKKNKEEKASGIAVEAKEIEWEIKFGEQAEEKIKRSMLRKNLQKMSG